MCMRRNQGSHPVILCADDYGMSSGVSRGILELAQARRISATSAIVTLDRWAQDGPVLRSVRDRISIGLHLNLTVGRPLGPMPRLAPDGGLPSIGTLVKAAVCGRLDKAEIETEVLRQIDRFIAVAGFIPDHIDGHQHVQVLPTVRSALVAVVNRRLRDPLPLVRDPADDPRRILRRKGEMVKALGVAALSLGFGALLRRNGIPTNRGFSGFSAFDEETDYALELRTAATTVGPAHILMCHPGYPDEELAGLDPVVDRRAQESATLLGEPGLLDLIWHANRSLDGPPIDWNQASFNGF